jgi:hypothetical protein
MLRIIFLILLITVASVETVFAQNNSIDGLRPDV